MANLACPSQDINFLSPNGFLFSIERLPKVSYFAQTISIPTVSIQRLDYPTPLSNIGIPGDKQEFAPLVVPFIVDETMSNYLEVFRWIEGLGFPQDYQQYRTQNNTRERGVGASEVSKNYSDATLIVLGSNNMPVKTFVFVDCFPTSLSISEMGTTNTDVQYAVATATFEYSYFRIED